MSVPRVGALEVRVGRKGTESPFELHGTARCTQQFDDKASFEVDRNWTYQRSHGALPTSPQFNPSYPTIPYLALYITVFYRPSLENRTSLGIS